MSDSIRVATLNCRNTLDLWHQRRHLLADQLRELQPDVIGLQELRRRPSQSGWIANHAADPAAGRYQRTHAWKGGWWRWAFEGVGTLSLLPVLEHERRGLTLDRAALRTTVRLPSGQPFDIYTTHLHHPPEASDLRGLQAGVLAEWISRRATVPHVLVGDLNGTPDSAELKVLLAGMRSAHVVANGAHPAATFPAPTSAGWGDVGRVIDYILIGPGITVRSAGLAFDKVSADDARVSPSDHYGLVAELTVG